MFKYPSSKAFSFHLVSVKPEKWLVQRCNGTPGMLDVGIKMVGSKHVVLIQDPIGEIDGVLVHRNIEFVAYRQSIEYAGWMPSHPLHWMIQVNYSLNRFQIAELQVLAAQYYFSKYKRL